MHALHHTGHRGQRSDDEDEEEEEGEVEEEEVAVKKGSDEDDSNQEAEQKEKKADGSQVVFSPSAAAQFGFSSHLQWWSCLSGGRPVSCWEAVSAEKWAATCHQTLQRKQTLLALCHTRSLFPFNIVVWEIKLFFNCYWSIKWRIQLSLFYFCAIFPNVHSHIQLTSEHELELTNGKTVMLKKQTFCSKQDVPEPLPFIIIWFMEIEHDDMVLCLCVQMIKKSWGRQGGADITWSTETRIMEEWRESSLTLGETQLCVWLAFTLRVQYCNI